MDLDPVAPYKLCLPGDSGRASAISFTANIKDWEAKLPFISVGRVPYSGTDVELLSSQILKWNKGLVSTRTKQYYFEMLIQYQNAK